eukprot:m.181400 g.181400  ORF g.181400 m.181400 type:complete len:62 (-) comp25453_c0_seq1:196-381(-)
MRPRRTFVELKQDRQRCTPNEDGLWLCSGGTIVLQMSMDLVEVSSDDDYFYSLGGRWKLMN